MHTRTRSLIALTAISGLALTACGSSWPQDEMEEELENAFDEQHPQDAPHEVDCPGDLDAEEGEQMECELTDANGSGTLQVEIVEVDGSDIEYEAELLSYE